MNLTNINVTSADNYYNASTNATATVYISTDYFITYFYNTALGLITAVSAVGFFSCLVVLCAMLTLASRKKTTHILIINQLVLDMLTCLFVFITQSVQFNYINKQGPLRLLDCYFIQASFMDLSGLAASITNLIMITLERYFKIVFSIYHRKYFKKWMVYLAVVFAWVSGILQNIAVFFTSKVINGVCYPYRFWPAESDQVHALKYFILFL